MSRVRFQIIPPVCHPEETLRLVGNLPELGRWEPSRGLKLEWRDPFHVATLELPEGTEFEYKILRDGWESEAVDAYGHVPANERCAVWFDQTVRKTVADWKDRYSGRLTRDSVRSEALASGRQLLIWLPPEYAAEPDRRFPVIFLHDGDNVFDPASSPLSGVDWAADESALCLSRCGELPPCIVVGICHPEGFAEANRSLREVDLSPELGGTAYAEFLVREVVPHLDSRYRTLGSPEGRILGGAGLGALNAFFTALRYPGQFGGFLCLSTSFEDVSQSLPEDAGELLALEETPSMEPGIRMYFSYGTEGIDECYEPYHQILRQRLTANGWHEGREFVIRRVTGGRHDELLWRREFPEALQFLRGRLG